MSGDESYLEQKLREETAPEGYERLYCVNHPHLRWQRRAFNPRRISNNPHLMFLGDSESGKCGSAMPVAQSHFDEWDEESKTRWTEKFAVECDCPYSDLKVIE